jgi:hypothetical protein
MSRVTRFILDAENPLSLAGRARSRRWLRLAREFPDLADMTVLDLGGVVSEWTSASVRPARVTVLNLFPQPSDDTTEVIVGDACTPPPELDGRTFDLVFSNSVIDQVGGHFRRLQFRDNVQTFAPRHWIQTAYRYFPVDAYTLFPWQQSLPLKARAALSRHWPLGYRHSKSYEESVMLSLAIDSLSKTAFQVYFPDSLIITERVGGLVKSLTAVRR